MFKQRRIRHIVDTVGHRRGSTDLRIINGPDLLRLMDSAASADLHAKGRPDWVRANISRIEEVLVNPLLVKRNPITSLRCNISVILDNAVTQFWIDISPDDYLALPRIGGRTELARIVTKIMVRVPVVPTSEEQPEAS